MRKLVAFLSRFVAVMAGGIVFGVVLLTLAFWVPVNTENMQKSYEIMEKEGWYPAMPILSKALDTYFHSFLPGVLDDTTDRIMLESALETTENNPLRAAMDMRGYSYYWHGYVAILRPLLSIFDYSEIRFLNCIGQLLLIFCLMHTIWKSKGLRYALVFFSSYAFLMPMAMQMSLQFSWVFYIAYSGVAIIIYRYAWLEKESRIFLVFLGLGMATSFFDLLTYPLYTWAIPMVWLLVVADKENTAWYYVKRVIYTGFSWIAGYAGMWIAKWIIGGCILKRNIFEIAMKEVFFRAGMEENAVWGGAERAAAMYANWKHYEYKIYFLILSMWLLWIIVKSIRCGCVHNRKNPALLLIASSSVVWFFVLSNHTQGHHFFTYRIWGISIIALLILWCQSLRYEKKRRSLRQLFSQFILWGAIAVIAFGCSFLAREDIRVLNGGAAYFEEEITQSDVVKVIFTPTFPRITELGVGIRAEATQGEYVIELFEQGKLLYSESADLSRLKNGTFITIPVDWKLKAQKSYEMRTSVRNTNGKTYILVTEHMEMPINEYETVSINDKETCGQPIAGFTYHYRPLSRATLLFLTISWMGVIASLLFEINQIIRVLIRFPRQTAHAL